MCNYFVYPYFDITITVRNMLVFMKIRNAYIVIFLKNKKDFDDYE